MKKGSKIKKIVPALALALPLALLAVLGAFTSLKTAKADFPPVYNNESEFSTLTDTPFSLYETSVVRGANIDYGASDDGYARYSFDAPRFSLTQEGSINIFHSIDEVGMYGRVEYDMQTPSTMRLRAFFDSSDINVGVYEGIQLTTYRPFYADEGLYNRLIKSTLAPLRVTSASDYARDLRIFYTIHYDLLTEEGLASRIVSNQTRTDANTSFNVTGFLPIYDALTSSALEDDYIYVRSVSLTFLLVYEVQTVGVNSRVQLTAGGTSPTDISYNGFNDVQTSAINFFYTRNVKPVDDIGLGVITSAVTAFLNTEFIPGFKLWYFLLIGLGVMITGLALKFFLGG